MNPLLVGELNPYGADPEFALYPLPEHASGGRLARILGLSRGEYLRRFDRANLCTGRWSMPEAREAAAFLRQVNRPIILLGTRVATAFGVNELGPWWFGYVDGVPIFTLPHPSGRNRMWLLPDSVPRTRSLLGEFLVPRVPASPAPRAPANLAKPDTDKE